MGVKTERLAWKYSERERKKKTFSFLGSRGRVSDTDASFVRLTHGRGMELLCGVERFHHKNREESPLQAAGAEQRESLNVPVQSVESPVSQTEYSGVEICC